MNFCPNCGAKSENPDSTFCSNCGFKFAGKGDDKKAETIAPKKETPISWDDDDTLKTSATAEDLKEIDEETPVVEDIPAPTTPSRRNISAYDDDVDSSEDLFIVPKGSRASRPITQRSRPEKRPAPILDEGNSDFPDLFSEEEATSMFAASHEESENFAPFGDAGGDPETDTLVSSRVEKIKNQLSRQEQAAAARASRGDLFEDDIDSTQEDAMQSSSQAERPQYARAQRPRTSRPQRNNGNIFEQSSPSRYSEPTQVMHTGSTFEDDDDDYEYEYEYDDEPVKSKKSRGSSGSSMVKIIIPIFIVLVILAGFFGFKLTNTPKKTIDTFITAVEDKDIATLKKITRLDNIPTATEANWLAFCNGLTKDGSTAELRSQLTAQITDPQNFQNSYPAVHLVTKTTLGVFKTYKVAAMGVNLTVPQAQVGTILKLDDVSYTGVETQTDNGPALVYSNIMPGLYNACQLVGPNGSSTEPFQLSIYGGRNWENLPLPDGNVAPSDTTNDGASSGSETATSTVPSSSDIDGILSSFYSSYLVCINNQSISSLTSATDAMGTEVEALMQKSGNKSNKFDYVGASCDASTISADNDSNPTKITVNATFTYKYTPRDGGTTEPGSSSKKMELINVNGTWVVNSMQNI